jgi:hypothetical protein
MTAKLVLALGSVLAFAGVVGAVRAQSAAEAQPVVVELFQSQGCSSCPPADINVNAVADRPGVLALSFAVTYWDDLGWKDTFASPQFTARQWAYAHGLRHGNVYTPQVVINGRRDLVGNDAGELSSAIGSAVRPATAKVTLTAGRATVEASPAAGTADVWLVRYDPRVQQVPIQRGENGGKTIAHKNIVRQLVRLGGWSGQRVEFALPASTDSVLKTAVLVQARNGGPILAAAKG